MVPVVCQYLRSDGALEVGSVLFRPIVSGSIGGADPRVYTVSFIEARLDAYARISLELVDSSDPGWMMDMPMPYKVVERLGGSMQSYYIYVNGPGEVDLATVERYTALELVRPGSSSMTLKQRGR